ncbi:MAG TPA: branched-chain amino acid ABC transporter permease [Solirubrobacteraceae bacterium]|nr:branched-chain amino acid ABC transporter permease [Solirubrobacteraceae bacterium]
MSAITTAQTVRNRAAGPLQFLRQRIGSWGLIIALAALPVYYTIHDLTAGYQAGLTNSGHPIIHHDLSIIGVNIVEGLSSGAVWALIAIGYTLVYGIIELINFAHGDVFTMGSFAGASIWTTLGLTVATGPLGLIFGLALTLILTMLITGSLNVLIERVAYKPLRRAPKLAPLITAIGFSFVLQNVGLLWQGGNPVAVEDLTNETHVLFNISGVPIYNRYVLAIGVLVPLVLALNWFVNRTSPGRAMRATAQDPEAARLMGINVNNTISLAFMLGGMLAGAAGIVYALYGANMWYFQGFQAGLYAFTAAVMGGIGNIRGAVLGGLIIGIVQQLCNYRLGTEWTEAVIFVYLIVVMVLRPRGLLGEETREAG